MPQACSSSCGRGHVLELGHKKTDGTLLSSFASEQARVVVAPFHPSAVRLYTRRRGTRCLWHQHPHVPLQPALTLLAFCALKSLAVPVRNIVCTPLSAGACPNGVLWLWMQHNLSPPPHHLLCMCLCCAMLRINSNLTSLDAALGLQRMMQCMQANALRTSTHCLVRVCEPAHTPESTDNVPKCTLTNFVFDC